MEAGACQPQKPRHRAVAEVDRGAVMTHAYLVLIQPTIASGWKITTLWEERDDAEAYGKALVAGMIEDGWPEADYMIRSLPTHKHAGRAA